MKEEIDKEIADAIHYPKCWDIMAYPTLAHALWEMCFVEQWKVCATCGKKQGLKEGKE